MNRTEVLQYECSVQPTHTLPTDSGQRSGQVAVCGTSYDVWGMGFGKYKYHKLTPDLFHFKDTVARERLPPPLGGEESLNREGVDV